MIARIGYKLTLICITGLMLAGCNHQHKKVNHQKHKTAQPATSTQEDSVVDLIMNLEEVKYKSAQVEKDSKGKRHLVTYVETQPTAKDPNYWIKVSEDNGDNLVAYYTFAVHANNNQISYYDAVHDTLISLHQWRKETPLNER